MQQHAGHAEMQGLAQAARPGRAGCQCQAEQQDGGQREAQGQESQRFGMRQAELGADEAGAPQQHEKSGGPETEIVPRQIPAPRVGGPVAAGVAARIGLGFLAHNR